jgi:hypothetical protein
MSVARFNVFGLMTRARPEKGTVEIDRTAKTFSVRPHRMHRTYTLNLDDVASFVVRTVIHAEVREKRAAKKAAKKGRG